MLLSILRSLRQRGRFDGMLVKLLYCRYKRSSPPSFRNACKMIKMSRYKTQNEKSCKSMWWFYNKNDERGLFRAQMHYRNDITLHLFMCLQTTG